MELKRVMEEEEKKAIADFQSALQTAEARILADVRRLLLLQLQGPRFSICILTTVSSLLLLLLHYYYSYYYYYYYYYCYRSVDVTRP